MTTSQEIQNLINSLIIKRDTAVASRNQYQGTCFNSRGCDAMRNTFTYYDRIAIDTGIEIDKLREDLRLQKEKELTEIKIETKLDIIPNPLNQLGESLEPITDIIQKPEIQGSLLIAGLVVAALFLKN